MKNIILNFLGLIITGFLAYGLSFYWIFYGLTFTKDDKYNFEAYFLTFFILMIYILLLFFLFKLIKEASKFIQTEKK